MLSLLRDSQLPKQFRDLPPRDVADFNWLTFSQITPRQKFIPDDEAVGEGGIVRKIVRRDAAPDENGQLRCMTHGHQIILRWRAPGMRARHDHGIGAVQRHAEGDVATISTR